MNAEQLSKIKRQRLNTHRGREAEGLSPTGLINPPFQFSITIGAQSALNQVPHKEVLLHESDVKYLAGLPVAK